MVIEVGEPVEERAGAGGGPGIVAGPEEVAYRLLARILDSGRYRATVTARDGDLVTVHSHRVLHGRLPDDPANGA